MDRWEWTEGVFQTGEFLIEHQSGVALYDGNEKTSFENGVLSLTTHRLLWKDHIDRKCCIGLPLSVVIYLEEQASGFAKSAKIVVHLSSPQPNKASGPKTHSPYSYIRLSFREAGERQFHKAFLEELKNRRWEKTTEPTLSAAGLQPRHRPGIVGIERSIQEKYKATSKHISVAFEDLSKLMETAKDMVNLSKNIAAKIKEKQGDITEDETIKFKSYLLSMGIPNPVTRETHGTGDKYYSSLARELVAVLEKPIEECGGMMTLTDVYCRVNRARGMELLSPEDLLHGCELMELLRLPIRLRTFDSGVMVLQIQTHNEEEVITKTSKQVEERVSLTAEELAQLVGVSVILAKERLLLTEKVGGVCRDETVEGLRFYPNYFLTRVT
ncbi:vacuolar protein-sorting-associated protein 36-like [Gigantopelta aegis]|uniref:vacuolar protein-sorting-associated protein 36-like n=1 Tax=Gigantopelta aegis TaxID=1735272 RepID=UPI001B88B61C|nr:vacuolar protein-sorting-associated protein 36-like [Gigantopelta aegis]